MVLGTTKKAQKQNKLAKLPSIEEETERLKNIPKAIAPNEVKNHLDVSTGEQISREEAVRRIQERAENPELREQATAAAQANKFKDEVRKLTLQQQIQEQVRKKIAEEQGIPLDETPIPDINALKQAVDIEGKSKEASDINKAFGANQVLTGDTIGERAKQAPKAVIISTKDALDNVATFLSLGLKDTADVKSARKQFADTITDIDTFTSQVANGTRESAEVEELVREALKANRILERKIKEKGLGNLPYWLGRGGELETESKSNVRILEQKLIDLQVAKQLGNQAKVTALISEGVDNGND